VIRVSWRTVGRLSRRVGLWAVVCTVSAAPAYSVGVSEGYDSRAMMLGVALFIVVPAVAICTPAFERLVARPAIRWTLWAGYGLRVALSTAYPLAVAVDMWPGMATEAIAELIGFGGTGFDATLVHTIIQGTLMNVLVFVVMLMIHPLVVEYRRRREVDGPTCMQCGYARRGLAPETRCPECGADPADAFVGD
jgi:hypothetical protein